MSSGFQPTLSFILCQSDDSNVEDDQVILLKSRLENDPYNYELHLSLVGFLQTQNKSVQLRRARENMQSIFPLSPTLWLRWLEDELANDTNDTHSTVYINELFEQALLDQPYSPELWIKYLKYSESRLTPVEMRDLFERAVFTAGYNLINGFEIFQLLGEYLLENNAFNQQTEKVSNNEKTYLSDLYAVRLKIPHLDATLSAFDDYETFNKQQLLTIDLLLTQEHAKIIDIYTKIEPLLRALSDEPTETNFRELINFFNTDNDAFSCADNNLFIEALYEMCLSFNEVNINIWKEYINLISKTNNQRVSKVYERAVRFVPWDVVIWSNYLHFSSDNLSGSTTKVEKIFNNALTIGFNFPEQYLLLYQAYISHFIQHGTIDQVMGVFHNAFEFFIKHYGEQSPSLMFLYELKGDYLLLKEENAKKFIEFWDLILGIDDQEPSDDNVKNFPAHIWINYIKQLLNLELIDKALEIMSISLSRVVGSETPLVVATYVNLKLLFGENKRELSIDFLSHLDSAISSIVQYNWLSTYKQSDHKNRRDRDLKKKEHGKPPQKRTKPTTTSKIIVDSDGFKVPSKSPKLPPTSVPHKPTASQPTKSPAEATNTDVPNLNSIEKIPKERKERTIFLSNISFDVGEDVLRKLFEECGEVVEVRLAKSRTNRSKGYGYLEFTTAESTNKALLLDRTLVDNRPLYVSPCIDKTKESLPFKYNTNLSENTLFVSKLSKETTPEKLKEVFQELSDDIKEIRLVTNRSGNSKGYAYMELADSTAASKAILMYDGTVIDGATISIAKSNPPKRKESTSKKANSSSVPKTKNSHFPPNKNDSGWATKKTRLIVANSDADDKDAFQKQIPGTEDPCVSKNPDAKRTNNYFKTLFK